MFRSLLGKSGHPRRARSITTRRRSSPSVEGLEGRQLLSDGISPALAVPSVTLVAEVARQHESAGFAPVTIDQLLRAGGKVLGSLSGAESQHLARAVFGDSVGADLLTKLDQKYGGQGTLIEREIALGYHEGGLVFGRENGDPTTGYDIGTFQINGGTRSAASEKFQRTMKEGIELYEQLAGKHVDQSKLTIADKDVLSHVGHIKERGAMFHEDLFRELADRSLSREHLVDLISQKIQGGVRAIGEDVYWKMGHQGVNLPAVDARAKEGGATRALPAMATLQRPVRGAEVTILQRALNKLGYHLAADGDFGEKTQDAVKGFQRKYGLTADGVVGTKTWGALYREVVKAG